MTQLTSEQVSATATKEATTMGMLFDVILIIVYIAFSLYQGGPLRAAIEDGCTLVHWLVGLSVPQHAAWEEARFERFQQGNRQLERNAKKDQ